MRRLREKNDESGLIDKQLMIQLFVNYFKVSATEGWGGPRDGVRS